MEIYASHEKIGNWRKLSVSCACDRYNLRHPSGDFWGEISLDTLQNFKVLAQNKNLFLFCGISPKRWKQVKNLRLPSPPVCLEKFPV